MSKKEALCPVSEEQKKALIQGAYCSPHEILGLVPQKQGDSRIILWRPGATEIYLEFHQKMVLAECIDKAGLFEFVVPANTSLKDYRVYHQNGLLAHDPYAFFPTLKQEDLELFSRGLHYDLYRILGAHPMINEGIEGFRFAVWVPNAARVSLIGNFNHWDGRVNPMCSMGASGVWELFVPGISEGEKYKFEIKTSSGEILTKSDPLAFASELRPANASVTACLDRYSWNDGQWLKERCHQDLNRPMLIYEVHLGSWRRDGENFPRYRELACQLADYCQEMGFTHVELMPIAEHPLDDSWGYQTTGYYCPTSRFGTLQDFQYFVDFLHQNEIGVILDWVPAHFPQDGFGLGRFNGTALYEHAHPYQGFHPHWSTYIYNYGRLEVANFLIANALFWIEVMHIDGLRVDAVASMIYLDYGRAEGQWIPNQYGENINLEAIEFLKHLNSIVHQRHPGALTIAEESTAFPNLTKSLEHDGLGFDFKWNMGWMNDTLHYFSVDPFFRNYHHSNLTFSLLYAFSERYVLPFSHDEVVHCKRSLLSKMPGDLWQQYANMRLLYSYMICHPGKKLLFMGGEIGQREEWSCRNEIEWEGLQYDANHRLHTMIKELNVFYKQHPAFWEFDFDYRGFEWVDFDDAANSIVSYLRKGEKGSLFCIHNFTPVYHKRYFLKLSGIARIQEVFNTDALDYGGSGKHVREISIFEDGIELCVPPLATVIFKFEYAV